jgi:hypothetical protein
MVYGLGKNVWKMFEYGVRDFEKVIFGQEIRNFRQEFRNFRVEIHLTQKNFQHNIVTYQRISVL